jgi:hypothetical protein
MGGYIEWVRMTTSELGRCSQLRLGFAAGLRWARVFTAKSMCYISIAILALSNSQRGRDEVDSQMMFILYEQLLCVSQLRGFHT